ncbi:MAG: hypothetical protein H2055_03000 [Sphingopyxis sp.]|nr:hypothetical protein [Sphingopyxis sp.]
MIAAARTHPNRFAICFAPANPIARRTITQLDRTAVAISQAPIRIKTAFTNRQRKTLTLPEIYFGSTLVNYNRPDVSEKKVGKESTIWGGQIFYSI